MPETIKNRIYHKYEKESSKLKMVKHGAWTINLFKNDLSEIDAIVYETSKIIYSIDVALAQEVGMRLFLGGEIKLVVPLNFWKKIKKEN